MFRKLLGFFTSWLEKRRLRKIEENIGYFFEQVEKGQKWGITDYLLFEVIKPVIAEALVTSIVEAMEAYNKIVSSTGVTTSIFGSYFLFPGRIVIDRWWFYRKYLWRKPYFRELGKPDKNIPVSRSLFIFEPQRHGHKKVAFMVVTIRCS